MGSNGCVLAPSEFKSGISSLFHSKTSVCSGAKTEGIFNGCTIICWLDHEHTSCSRFFSMEKNNVKAEVSLLR